jgi:hypothetical protein
MPSDGLVSKKCLHCGYSARVPGKQRKCPDCGTFSMTREGTKAKAAPATPQRKTPRQHQPMNKGDQVKGQCFYPGCDKLDCKPCNGCHQNWCETHYNMGRSRDAVICYACYEPLRGWLSIIAMLLTKPR